MAVSIGVAAESNPDSGSGSGSGSGSEEIAAINRANLASGLCGSLVGSTESGGSVGVGMRHGVAGEHSWTLAQQDYH